MDRDGQRMDSVCLQPTVGDSGAEAPGKERGQDGVSVGPAFGSQRRSMDTN